MSKWIRFVLDDHADPKRKTEQWHVVSTSEVGVVLGDIKWYGGWRRYCFFPNNDLLLVFEEDCLRDIADFCVLQTKHYKAAREVKAS